MEMLPVTSSIFKSTVKPLYKYVFLRMMEGGGGANRYILPTIIKTCIYIYICLYCNISCHHYKYIVIIVSLIIIVGIYVTVYIKAPINIITIMDVMLQRLSTSLGYYWMSTCFWPSNLSYITRRRKSYNIYWRNSPEQVRIIIRLETYLIIVRL